MARCRSYLRGLSICVTVLLMVSGVVMIGVGFASIDANTPVAELFGQLSSWDGLLVLQVFGPTTVVLSVLGISAATLDLKPLLLVFSALIFVEFVALMVVASPLVQVQTKMDSAVDQVFRNATPLHRVDLYIQGELNKLQASDSCCGLRSYEDWESQIPASCYCRPAVLPPASETSSQQLQSDEGGSCVMVTEELWVHSQPCGPVLKSYMKFPIRLRIGIISAFSTITMAAIALCLALGLEEYWKKAPVETTVFDFDRVKYQPKPSPT